MNFIKLISIVLIMISSVFSEADLLSEITKSSIVKLNGIRDTLFEKLVKHIVNDYAQIEINYNEENVKSHNGFITKREVLKYIFANTIVDSIKNGIDSINLIENSEYFGFKSNYILTIGSIKSWYSVLFDDFKISIGYINYGNRVYKVYFDGSTFALIYSNISKIMNRDNMKKKEERGGMKNPASNRQTTGQS